LIVFTAPSGAGKTTLVKHLLKEMDNLAFSVSATTRSRRENEKEGKDYYFLTKEAFSKKLENKEFLEYQEVYDGNFYGTLIEEVDGLLQQGKHVIFDVDVEGALNIKKHYQDQALTVFVQAPSIEILRQRLMRRNSESPETLEIRVEKAAEENKYASRFDQVVLNDVLEVAKEDVCRIVNFFLTNDFLNSFVTKREVIAEEV
ncbi:MAG: guanylate kinase, partial [Chitinophagales bacterium]